MNDDLTPWEGRPDGRAPARLPESDFLRRTLLVTGVGAAAVAALLLLWYAADVFLLLFAGVLLALFLRGLADLLGRHTGLSGGWSLAVVLVALAALLAAGGWFLGARVGSQLDQFSERLAAARGEVEAYLQRSEWGRELLRQHSAGQLLPRRAGVVERVTGAFSTALGVLADLAVVLFVGLFVAAQPAPYRAGLLHLVPLRRRPRAGQVLDALGRALRRWMVGRLIDMAVVGVLTTLGLWLLGSPVPLVLGLLTFVIVFVPYVGPILSAIPAVLVALTQGPTDALYVALLYLGIQTVESYLLQPVIQQKAVDLPPAVVLGAQMLLGVLLGTLGLVLATPLAAAVFVLVKMLYVENALGDPVEVQAEQSAGTPAAP